MTAPIPRDIPELPAIPGVARLFPSSVPAAAVVTPMRRPLAAVCRLLIAALAAGGVTLALLLGSPARVLSHFTIQSNILLAVVCLASARRAWTARRPLPSAVTGATLLYVVIAALVHHLVLASATAPVTLTDGPLTGWHAVANHVLHTITPAAAVLDWLLLTTPDALRLRQTAAWMLYPLAYLGFCLTRSELLLTPGTPARYLYPFLDVEQYGYKSVLANALLLGLSFYGLAVLLVALDHLRPNLVRYRAHHRPKTGFRLRPPVG
ncbi:Pr6Pr family membrane protein [Streptomyces sp. XM83C]|uniref:Pr6Pr family membrane protein n=1 Tax=Streptomyces sp. XM83C TaxID=2929781 RepID=UPI001FF827DF|nr:Pr6Pr family membrane protein [Streptomyces sp. XM83C]MCK1823790.1 Pr6Pr family membrane protein [Streptomyces sp. XM83C]